MIDNYIIAMLVVLALMSGWIGVQYLARTFASRHPDFGPVREEGSGCGMFCFCKNGEVCPKEKFKQLKKDKTRPDKSL